MTDVPKRDAADATRGSVSSLAETAMKAAGKIPTVSLARLYTTWPNAASFRPSVYAFCPDCEQEKLFLDIYVAIAEADGIPLQCAGCKDAFRWAAIWSPHWRC